MLQVFRTFMHVLCKCVVFSGGGGGGRRYQSSLLAAESWAELRRIQLNLYSQMKSKGYYIRAPLAATS